MRRLTILALVPFSTPLFAGGPVLAPAPLFDDFENGINEGGWIYNPGDVIEASGGNPGGWWHQDFADTFAPIIVSQTATLAGDWRAAGVDRVTFDARLDHLDFGTGSGFEMTLLLRDTKGTPSFADDVFAYQVGPNIPLVGAGFKSFDFAVPSADTSALPAGWTGGYSGDAEHFPPGVDWNDVITSVDRVEIHWMNPAFFAIFQVWDIGLDNVAVHADGAALVRNGSGVNPLGYASTSTPTLGATWTATVDLATPGHVLSAVAVSFGGATQGIFPGGAIAGELLVLPGFVVDVQTGSHALPVPANISLLGTLVPTQAATVASDGSIHLNNALDLVLGD